MGSTGEKASGEVGGAGASTASAEAVTRVVDLPVGRIRVAPGRRPAGDVAALAASIAEVGRLLQPIVVNRRDEAGDGDGADGEQADHGNGDGVADYRLVAGLTRLEAARRLGWASVPASVVDLDADSAELAELDENLARAELSAARRAALTWRRQQAYERKFPESRARVAGGLARQRGAAGRGDGEGEGGDGAERGGDDSASATIALAESATSLCKSPVPPRSFARDTAALAGRSERTVQLDARVGRELGASLLEEVEGTPIASSRAELLRLTRVAPARRPAVVAEVHRGGHARVSRAEAALARSRRFDEQRRRAAGSAVDAAGSRPWSVVTGDCLDVLAAAGGNPVPADGRRSTAPDDGTSPAGPALAPGSVRMAFADPPYDLGKDYGRGRDNDRKGEAGYAEFTRRWVGLCAPLLTPDGSLWLLVDHRCLRAALNAVADAGLHQRSVVFWPDPFAQYQKRNFTPGRFLVYAVKDAKGFVFHPDAVAVPSKRQTEYADTRADPSGRTPSGWWDDVPTLCGTFAERGQGVTQLPVALVERPLLACTDPGDLVLDPFGGEGTTAVAAVRHGRRAVLVEADAERAERARGRVGATPGCPRLP